MVKTKEKKFLKDDIARKVLNAEECREYLIRIIALSLDFDIEEVRENIRMVDTSVGNHSKLVNQETDVLFESEKDIYNVEINYNYYEEGKIKNSCYIANLMIRQTMKGNGYKNFKRIHQINLNNYDFFHEGKFIYRSSMMEETLYKKRDSLIHIIDINLDFLNQVEYNDIKKLNEMDLQWLLYIFVCSNELERKELYKENQVMRRVYQKMDDLTKSLNELLYYDHEEFQKSAAYNEGNKDGREEGIKLGRKEEKIEIAKKLLNMNLTKEQIQNATDLSFEEVQKIQEEIKKS